MEQNNVIDINSELMTNRVTDINNKITSINDSLSKIKELSNSDNFGIGGDLESNISSKFESITDDFTNIISNLEVIVSELVACQGNYQINDEEVAAILRERDIEKKEVN